MMSHIKSHWGAEILELQSDTYLDRIAEEVDKVTLKLGVTRRQNEK